MDINTNALCIIKLEKLSVESILIAQHGIQNCFVKLVKLEQKEVDKWITNPVNSKKGTNNVNLN